MMKTKVKKVVVHYEDDSVEMYWLISGATTTTKTRVKGRVPGNEDVLTDVYQMSVHGEIDRSSDDAVTPSDPPQSIPEMPEEAQNVDD